MLGENLDLSSGGSARDKRGVSRRFVGVNFACCGCYAKVYINRDGTAYEGRCPRCARPVQIGIGAGGTDSRFFTAH
jgi:hypothetical protein